MTLINKAVLAQCVGRDGGAGTDQFLTDPRDCHFDPKALLCTGGKVPPACLTADQVTTIQKYYAGTIDPVNGQVINPGSERGNETDDVRALGLAFQEQLPEPAFDGLFYWVFGPSFGHPSSAVNFANFDFHRDIDTVDDRLAKVLNADSTVRWDERVGPAVIHDELAAMLPELAEIDFATREPLVGFRVQTALARRWAPRGHRDRACQTSLQGSETRSRSPDGVGERELLNRKSLPQFDRGDCCDNIN
jgi:hypothetical protein